MKKIIYYLAMAMIAISCMNTVNNAQTTIKAQFQYDSTPKTYQLQANQDLVVMVNGLRKYDVLSIEPDNTSVSTNAKTKSITLKAWEVAYTIDAATTTKKSAIQAINNLPDSNISFSKGILLINASGANKRSVIHLDIPSGVRAKVYVNGVQYHSGSLSGAMMVQNSSLSNTSANTNSANGNSVTDKATYSPEASLIAAMSPKPSTNTDALNKVFKRIDSSTLNNLATRKVTPAIMQDKGQNWAMVDIEVNEAGQVTSVSYVAGDTRLADFSSTTLKQFKFKPFVANDKAIKVGSLVPITSVDGKISLFSQIKQ